MKPINLTKKADQDPVPGARPQYSLDHEASTCPGFFDNGVPCDIIPTPGNLYCHMHQEDNVMYNPLDLSRDTR
jgi:hypothetical protein